MIISSERWGGLEAISGDGHAHRYIGAMTDNTFQILLRDRDSKMRIQKKNKSFRFLPVASWKSFLSNNNIR